MIDKLDFENFPVSTDNLGATRASGSSTSRTSSTTPTRSTSSSSVTSSLSFTERLKAAAESAVSAAKKIQATAVAARNPSATELTTQSRNTSPATATTPRTAPTSTTTTGSRSGGTSDGTQHTTTGQSSRASQARTPEENSDLNNANRYLTQFKELAKKIEEQGFVVTSSQAAELQEIISQYQKFNGDAATLELMKQYNQLPVSGGSSSDNPLMAAFGNIDAKKAMIIGGVIIGLAVLKKAAKKE